MAWNIDQRFPSFEVDGTKFMLTFQQDDYQASVVLLQWSGAEWLSWGGEADISGYIVGNVTEDIITEKGPTLHAFITWCCEEAVRRTKIRAALPIPDHADRIARLKYNLLMSVDWDAAQGKLAVKPMPLP